jgi:PAS domain S-box-containing protein
MLNRDESCPPSGLPDRDERVNFTVMASDLETDAGFGDTVGYTRLYFADQSWEWSPQVARLHGYEPGSVTPTTELIMSHKHPDDLPQVEQVLKQVREDLRPWSSRHRIIDTHGAVREVVVVGSHLRDEHGEIIGTEGFYVDVTPVDHSTEQITAALAEITANRAEIEQAKGMLMLIYRIDADRAFEILRWRSGTTNTKLRTLAQQITAAFRDLPYGERLPNRSVYDNALLTAHERVAASRGA